MCPPQFLRFEDGELTEYRGRESYEPQSADGRGGQSGMFDQTDYPPRRIGGADADGQLVAKEDRPRTAAAHDENRKHDRQVGQVRAARLSS